MTRQPDGGAWRTRRIGPGPALLGIAVSLSVLLRGALVISSDFPLRDGGLFVTMAHNIRNAGFALPQFSTFNAGDIPFAYPPLGLYILAVIPGDPITTERWLPLLWSLLAIPGLYLLAREFVSERIAGVTTLLFALMPVTWAIEGAGVTRALAFALLVWSLWAAKKAVSHPSVRGAAVAGFLGGLAGLTHPAIGPAWLLSVSLFFAFKPSRRSLATLLGVIAVAATTVAPWLLLVVSRHGVGVLLSAGTSHGLSETLGRLLSAGPSYIGVLDLVLPLALVGIAVMAHRREWILPLWLALLVVVPGGEGRYAAMGWALLAGIGAITIADALAETGAQRTASVLALTVLMFGAVVAGYQTFRSISPQIRSVMSEAGRAAPPGTRFAVYSDDARLEAPILDWFPTLSRQVSIGTYMGLEWTTAQHWAETVAIHHRIQNGEIPDEATAIFRVRDGVATWQLLP
jgi:4-amino-4-deoxy-L-arabinose transferase-like glycosyltransferase